MYLLGISAYYHDSSACILKDDKIIAAVQEERFTRRKNDNSFPINSINYCLKEANIHKREIDNVIFYDKPFLKFERIIETYLAFAPRGIQSFIYSMPIWLKEKLFQKNLIIKELRKLDKNVDWKKKLLFSEHHLSHAASAFYPSPFEEAAILTMDGVGEWATSSLSFGKNNKITILKEMYFPHSLGLLYSAFTYYIGFKVNSGEYKLMGLAPYGQPKYYDIIKENLIDIKDDGSFFLNMDYFNYCVGLTMTNRKFDRLFGGPARKNESEITQKEMDIASSIQLVTEEIILKTVKHLKQISNTKNLCLSGGVALNCVANGRILKSKIFENIWIQPASGDAGGSLGAAYATYFIKYNKLRKVNRYDTMQSSLLGPQYSEKEIEDSLQKNNMKFKKYKENEVYKFVSQKLVEQKTIGWMQGRMEFGPRALGCRSILADPRAADMQKKLNLKIKFRESFRPFAPSVIEEKLSDWFNTAQISPYMLFVSKVQSSKRIKIINEKFTKIDQINNKRSSIPAVTHVDYTARIQTVSEKSNTKFYKLLEEFFKITGCPILINTSFNVRGEPIVCSPDDAINCFMSTDLDILVMQNYILIKSEQDKKNKLKKIKYKLD
tara:strand:- start:49 stop:1872 length:1824 start_codon:yes stop_codon:yes gene_type:complete